MFRLMSSFVSLMVLVAPAWAQSQPDLWWIEAHFNDRSQLQHVRERFQHVDVDFEKRVLEVDGDKADIEWLRQQGFEVMIDYGKSSYIQSFVGKNFKSIPGFSCYRTVEETRTSAASLVSTYPNLAQIVEIGNSWEKTQNAANGYTLQVLKLGNNATPIPPGVGGKPKLFMMGSLHAREYPTAELVTRFAEQLLSQYNVEADATWILDRFELHLLLHANPDGRKRAEAGVLWRKNTNIVSAPCGGTPTSSSHPGIDLNRNFPWQWAGGGSFCSQSYPGPSASSEPETSAIATYERQIFDDRRGTANSDAAPSDYRGMFVDVHNAASDVAWPWGNGNGVSGNNTSLVALGRRAAFFNGYDPIRSDSIASVFGASDDNAYGEFGAPTLLFELTSGSFFETCTSFLNTTLPTNLNAFRYLTKTLWAPYQLALGPSVTNIALSASSVVQGTSVTLTGTINENTQSTVGFSASTIPIQGANVFIDALPWDGIAASVAASASDGSFNTATENISATINTSGLSIGRHLIVLQGRNTLSGGTAGPPSAIFLTVTPGSINQAPSIAAASTLNGSEDIPLAITGFTLSDPDAGSANVTLTLSSTAGALTASSGGGVVVTGSGSSNLVLTGTVASIQSFTNAGAVSFSFGLNQSGIATLTSTINDLGNSGTGGALSAQATTTITIAAVNDPPVAVIDQPSAINEDQGAHVFAVLSNDTDAENDAITVQSVGAVSPSAAGSVVVGAAGANAVFTPSLNYCGIGVSFTYTINGGSQSSSNFNINCINDAPQAVGTLPNVTAIEASALSVPTANGFSDVDNASLSYAVTSVPALPIGIAIHPTTGILSGTPPVGSAGTYTLTVTASDTALLNAQQVFTLTIQPPTLFADGFE